MDKRYQIFISSTYADLKEERHRVIQAGMEMDCIPAAMELFPAADEEQFQFIKRVIDDCDYYIVIIGGRYGTTTAEGISYTEQEYEYALSRGLKVIGLLHENPDDIPLGKSEKDPALRERLKLFRDRIATDRLVKFWKSAEELPGLVALSLSKTIKLFPAVGWVRADKVSSEEMLSEINELRKQNAELQKSLSQSGASPPPVENLAGLDDEITLHGTYFKTGFGTREWDIRRTWGHIFGLIGPYLIKFPSDDYVKSVLDRSLFDEKNFDGSSASLNDQDFQTVAVQFRALGLVTTQYTSTTKGGMALFWHLTQKENN